tara:strand:- start:62 stop:1156 length:1095 start_codon:yes stop_codon:yes gene_type:complete
MKKNRYFPPELFKKFLNDYSNLLNNNILGYSVKGLPIHELQVGFGKQKILMWSQMHGNESTTTKALLDLIPWLLRSKQKNILSAFTFFIIPQLNPDGSKSYSRLNANQIDLNRDALKLSQPESRLLSEAYKRIMPDYALNLHGQRTVYGAGSNGGPSTISFLAPSADKERTITPARAVAMSAISHIYKSLKNELPKGISRYDDSFNPNCVGDLFSKAGTPTILFEAGHFPGDYDREHSRKYIFKSFKILFNYLLVNNKVLDIKDYLNIPENIENYVDLIVSNINIIVNGITLKNQQIAIQYIEELKNGEVVFLPSFHSYSSDPIMIKSHRYIELSIDNPNEPLIFIKGKIIENSIFDKLFSLDS